MLTVNKIYRKCLVSFTLAIPVKYEIEQLTNSRIVKVKFERRNTGNER